jgi:hypothetical protein
LSTSKLHKPTRLLHIRPPNAFLHETRASQKVDSSRFNKLMKQFALKIKSNEAATLVKAGDDVHGGNQAWGCAVL